MNEIKILIVEDDADINNLLAKILKKEGYEPVQAYSGTEAWLRLDQDAILQYSLILLDLMLPGLMGEELIGKIRTISKIPILVLSAKSALQDRVAVLNLGADDYLTKPFEKDEVIARVNSALRRYLQFGSGSGHKGTDCGRENPSIAPRESASGQENPAIAQRESASDQENPAIGRRASAFDQENPAIGQRKLAFSREDVAEGSAAPLCYKNLALSVRSREVTVLGSPLALTAHEFDLLCLLMQHPGKVFSRESLYEQVWRNGYYGEDNTVNVHISNLRKKIAAVDPDTEYIKTVWGIGFKL